MWQDFIISAAGAYTLKWYDNAAAGAPDSSYRMTITDGSSQEIVSRIENAAEGNGVWTERSILLSFGAASTYKISFSAEADGSGYNRLLDNVTLAAVPIPAAFWLVGSALAGLFGLTRRTVAFSSISGSNHES